MRVPECGALAGARLRHVRTAHLRAWHVQYVGRSSPRPRCRRRVGLRSVYTRCVCSRVSVTVTDRGCAGVCACAFVGPGRGSRKALRKT